MERIKHIFILLVFAVLLASTGVQAQTSESGEKTLVVPNTALALPADSKVKVRWVSPPLDPKTVSDASWYSLCFTVDSTGSPWIGYQEEGIVNPVKQHRIEMPIRYTSLACLDNGAFLVATEADLCYIAPKAKLDLSYDGIPTAMYQPIANLPVPDSKLYSGAGNCVYLIAPRKDDGSDVFLLKPDKSGIHGYTKVFTSDKTVTAVAGDGNNTFAAVGGVIVKITGSNGTVSKTYASHQEYIRGLAYSPGTGLFYSTNTGIGIIGAKGNIQIMATPEAKIALQNGTLYVLLSKSLGIIALDSIDDLKRFDRTVKEVPVPESNAIKINSIKFFEAGKTVPDNADRVFNTEFSKKTARYIYCQADVENLQYNKNQHKETLTMELYRSGRKEMLQSESVSFDINPEYSGMWGWTRFGSEEEGTFYPDVYTVKTYLNGTLVDESSFKVKGEPDLIEAAGHRDAAAVKKLIESGADVNMTTGTGFTPLMMAVYVSDAEIVKLLIDAGADINKKANDGETALTVVGESWFGDATITKMLIDAGADPNSQGKNGKTALHKSVYSGREAVVRYLLEHGAKHDIKDNDGQTPLLTSGLSSSYRADKTAKVVELLLAHGADPDGKDKNGNTALFNAIEGRNADAVEALLKHGANVNAIRMKYGKYEESILGSAFDQFNIFKGYREDRIAYIRIIGLLQGNGADFYISEYQKVYFSGIEKLLDTRHMVRLLEMSEAAARNIQPSEPILRKAVIRGFLNAACRQISETKDEYGYYSALRLLEDAGEKARKWGLISSCPEIYFNIGLVNVQIGSKGDARKYLKDYLDMAPTGSCAARARELMNQL